MRKQSNIILIITGAILFNLVFWKEKLAINTVIFDVFILTAIFRIYPEALTDKTVKWLLAGHVICVAMLVFHNTILSVFAYGITLLLLVGFSEYFHRSAWYAGGSVMLNFVLFIAEFFEQLKNERTVKGRRKTIFKLIRFSFFPLVLCFIFFIVYSLANTVLADITSKLGLSVQRFFSRFFELISPDRIAFLFFGLYLTGSLILKSRLNYFSKQDSLQQDELKRIRLPKHLRIKGAFSQLAIDIVGGFSKGIMALKNENVVGIASLVLLNILLLLVNIIDIIYVWLNFQYSPNINISAFVHEGTGFLIFSIIMAMMVVLFFFKGNLNFYQKNKWLKYGAYLWIFQNTVLVFSVFMRDYYYISSQGLAYKRIGVLFFLVMVLIGLITVAIKVYRKKTSYFLFRVNAWSGLVILVLSTTVNWDELIAKYNLSHKNSVELDIPFLLSLSDKTLPLLDREMDMLKQEEQKIKKAEDENNPRCRTCYVEILEKRENNFLKNYSKYSWLSWNYSDDRVSKYFQNKKGNGVSKN